MNRRTRVILSLVILACVCLIMALAEPHVVSLERNSLSAPAELAGMKIAFLSDVHVDSDGALKRLEKAVSRLNAEQPDLVLLGGDYADEDNWCKAAIAALEKLEAPLGVYAVLGNHDARCNAKAILLSSRLRLLENSKKELTYNGHTFYLCALADYLTGEADRAHLRGLSPEDFVLLLCHNPRSLSALSQEQAALVDAALCGHTHGGQVTLFGLYSPLADRPLPGWLSQWRQVNGVNTLYSNGLGTTALPLRFFAPPQIHLITLEE